MDKELIGYVCNFFEILFKLVYEYVFKDFEVESCFVQEFEEQDEVKFYVKFFGWFKILILLGIYNFDWVLVIEDNGEEYIYFVVEIKSKYIGFGNEEDVKIICGIVYFSVLKEENINVVKYIRVINFIEVISSI